MTPAATALLRSLHAEQRPGRRTEAAAVQELLAARLIEEFGAPVRWHNARKCTHRSDVKRAPILRGQSSLADMQQFAVGHF